jgi:hypothetical protein
MHRQAKSLRLTLPFSRERFAHPKPSATKEISFFPLFIPAAVRKKDPGTGIFYMQTKIYVRCRAVAHGCILIPTYCIAHTRPLTIGFSVHTHIIWAKSTFFRRVVQNDGAALFHPGANKHPTTSINIIIATHHRAALYSRETRIKNMNGMTVKLQPYIMVTRQPADFFVAAPLLVY